MKDFRLEAEIIEVAIAINKAHIWPSAAFIMVPFLSAYTQTRDEKPVGQPKSQYPFLNVYFLGFAELVPKSESCSSNLHHFH